MPAEPVEYIARIRKQYADLGLAIADAVKAFSEDVRAGRFPHA